MVKTGRITDKELNKSTDELTWQNESEDSSNVTNATNTGLGSSFFQKWKLIIKKKTDPTNYDPDAIPKKSKAFNVKMNSSDSIDRGSNKTSNKVDKYTVVKAEEIKPLKHNGSGTLDGHRDHDAMKKRKKAINLDLDKLGLTGRQSDEDSEDDTSPRVIDTDVPTEESSNTINKSTPETKSTKRDADAYPNHDGSGISAEHKDTDAIEMRTKAINLDVNTLGLTGRQSDEDSEVDASSRVIDTDVPKEESSNTIKKSTPETTSTKRDADAYSNHDGGGISAGHKDKDAIKMRTKTINLMGIQSDEDSKDDSFAKVIDTAVPTEESNETTETISTKRDADANPKNDVVGISAGYTYTDTMKKRTKTVNLDVGTLGLMDRQSDEDSEDDTFSKVMDTVVPTEESNAIKKTTTETTSTKRDADANPKNDGGGISAGHKDTDTMKKRTKAIILDLDTLGLAGRHSKEDTFSEVDASPKVNNTVIKSGEISYESKILTTETTVTKNDVDASMAHDSHGTSAREISYESKITIPKLDANDSSHNSSLGHYEREAIANAQETQNSTTAQNYMTEISGDRDDHTEIQKKNMLNKVEYELDYEEIIEDSNEYYDEEFLEKR